MQVTAFNQIHKRLGAKMVEFAGFEMPIEYSGIKDEHMTVRESVGVFDVSHMGEFWVKGPNALELVQRVTSNDVSKLSLGQAQYSCFPNGKGGIVDDLLVYYYEPEKYMLVVNASNVEKDWNWIVSHNTNGAILENSSQSMSQLAIQGPKAEATLQKITDIDLSEIKYYTFVTGTIGWIDDVIISATGYTGSGGFELYFRNEVAENMWNVIFEAGAEFGIKPIGLAARDTLRLEAGMNLYGQDMIDRGIPRHDYELTDQDGNVIGRVTSGTMSPVLNKGIGMGYVNKAYSAIGTEVFLNVRGKMLKAKIVKLPFINP